MMAAPSTYKLLLQAQQAIRQLQRDINYLFLLNAIVREVGEHA